jgi:hypothetical protein
LTEGDPVFVGASGGWTQTRPTGANLVQPLGIVTKVHATNGAGVVLGLGQFLDLPNLAQGFAFVGNSSGVAEPVQLAAVATSNNYNDLDNLPSIPNEFFGVYSTASTALDINASHVGRYVISTASTATTFTIKSGNFQVGDEVIFEQGSTGQITIASDGVSVIQTSSANTLKSAERFAVLGLKCVGSDVFTLTGERELL